MSRPGDDELAVAATRTLVGRDVGFVAGFLVAVQGIQPWLSMAYLDLASLVVYEIRQLRRKGVIVDGAEGSLSFERELSESRHSTKLLDDTRKTVDFLLEEFRRYAAAHRDQLVDMTRAPSLLRSEPSLSLLQDDTGIALCGGDVFATSHSVRHHVGLEMNAAPQQMHARFFELGAFLAGVRDEAAAGFENRTVAAHWSFPPVYAMDTRYEEFYGSTFPGVPLAESMALSMVACRLRAAVMLGEAARAAGQGIASLAFKFRFAAIWQAASTLRTIGVEVSGFQLGADLALELRRVQDTAWAALLDEPGCRLLRNVLVHYRLDPQLSRSLDTEDPLLGLPQLLCGGRSWRALDAAIDEAATTLLEMLDRWRGPVAHLLRQPPA